MDIAWRNERTKQIDIMTRRSPHASESRAATEAVVKSFPYFDLDGIAKNRTQRHDAR